MDKYEIFAELLAELEIAEKVLPLLFQNGFDEVNNINMFIYKSGK